MLLLTAFHNWIYCLRICNMNRNDISITKWHVWCVRYNKSISTDKSATCRFFPYFKSYEQKEWRIKYALPSIWRIDVYIFWDVDNLLCIYADWILQLIIITVERNAEMQKNMHEKSLSNWTPITYAQWSGIHEYAHGDTHKQTHSLSLPLSLSRYLAISSTYTCTPRCICIIIFHIYIVAIPVRAVQTHRSDDLDSHTKANK